MTQPPRTPAAAPERETLDAFLDLQRATAVAKVTGLSDAGARRNLVSSRTTVMGILNHLAAAERYWFRRHVAGDGWSYSGWETDEDSDWLVPDSITLSDLINEYERACQESREIADGLSMETLSSLPTELGRHVSLRWVIAHMTQETARHNGHLDILRELLDGSTGL